MNTTEHAAETSKIQHGVGRIMPLNMPSETNGLNYDSLLRDMTEANDHTQQHFDCGFWA
ncbi:MAG: hypothetical protein ABFD98_13970 [Syntrophobacteraceae bacterium]|nr:hypothetical protein [Desulfobacteraceae bacterium]